MNIPKFLTQEGDSLIFNREDEEFVFEPSEPNNELAEVCNDSFFNRHSCYGGNPLIYSLGKRLGESSEANKNYVDSLLQPQNKIDLPEMEM